jgi:hypothetical protein
MYLLGEESPADCTHHTSQSAAEQEQAGKLGNGRRRRFEISGGKPRSGGIAAMQQWEQSQQLQELERVIFAERSPECSPIVPKNAEKRESVVN